MQAKVRTSESHPIQVNFLAHEVAPFRGQLGMTFAPGKHQRDGLSGVWERDLATDVQDLADKYSTKLLVSLVEDHELRALRQFDRHSVCAKWGGMEPHWAGPRLDPASEQTGLFSRPRQVIVASWEVCGAYGSQCRIRSSRQRTTPFQRLSVPGRGRHEHLGPQVMKALSPVDRRITRGLPIRKEALDLILAGTKTWEIRGKATAKRGPVALIESGSGEVVGVCEIVDVKGPLSLAELQRNARKAGFRADRLGYKTTYAWVLRHSRRLREPIAYRHPRGAVIWVRLEPSVTRRLMKVWSLG